MKSAKLYKTLLFDLDGTLIDSKPGIQTAMRKALDAESVPYTQEILDQIVGPPFRISMRDFFKIHDEDLVEKLVSIYRGNYQAGDWRDCSIYPGVVDMLVALKEAGYVLGLATSKPLKYTTTIMNELDLSKHFDFVGGSKGDSINELKTDVINMVLGKLGVTDLDSVLMIGDRLYDVEGAKSSGVDSLGVLWGYGDKDELSSHGATFICESPSQIIDFLI